MIDQKTYLLGLADQIKEGGKLGSVRKEIRKSNFYLNHFKDRIILKRVPKYCGFLIIGYLLLLPISIISGIWLLLTLSFIIFIPISLISTIVEIKLFSRRTTGLTFEMTVEKLLRDVILGYGVTLIFILILYLINSSNSTLFVYFLIVISIAMIDVIASEYLLYYSINGAGMTLFYGHLLFLDTEIRPTSDNYLVEDYKGLVKGIDKWYFDALKLRIKNYDEILEKGVSQMANDLPKFQLGIKEIINEDIFIKLKDFKQIENLSRINGSLSNLLNIPINYKSESFSTNFSRNLSKIDTIIAICGLIADIVLTLVLTLFIK